MGQGPTGKVETARSPSSSAVEGGAGATTPLCERLHRLTFEPIEPGLAVDQGVAMQLGIPIAVVLVDSGQLAGHLTDGRESAIQECLLDGFIFDGRIVELDGRQGVVEVRGRKR